MCGGQCGEGESPFPIRWGWCRVELESKGAGRWEGSGQSLGSRIATMRRVMRWKSFKYGQ